MNRRAIAVWLALACVAGCNQKDPADPDDGPSDMEPDAGGGSAGSGGDGGSGAAGTGSGGGAGSNAGSGGGAGEAGGGAGSGAGGSAGSGGEPDVLEHFPLRDGASWTYLHSNGMWNEDITIAQLPDGRFMQTASADPAGVSSASTFAVVDGEVLRVAEDTLTAGVLDQTTTYAPGFLRFSQQWAEEDPGFNERREYQRTETKAGAAPKPPDARAHIFTVESVSEDVTVPAGTFRNCLRVHRMRDYDTTAPDGSVVTEDQEKLYWFCPGVGKVREENALTGTTELLMEYDLPE